MGKHGKADSVTINTNTLATLFIAVVVAVMLFNQYQIWTLSTGGVGAKPLISGGASSLGSKDLKNINLAEIKSTGHAVAAVFPVEDIATVDDAISIMIPTGTPEYGEALGVSFDQAGKMYVVASEGRENLESSSSESSESSSTDSSTQTESNLSSSSSSRTQSSSSDSSSSSSSSSQSESESSDSSSVSSLSSSNSSIASSQSSDSSSSQS